MGRREAKKEAKLRRIEAAARALFSERGYADTTTRAIAERANIAVGTLFTYFPEKRGLLLHVVKSDVQAAVDAAWQGKPEVPPHDPVDALIHVFDAIYAAYASDERLARVFAKEVMFASDPAGVDAAAWTGAFLVRLGALFEQWRRDGILGAHVDSPVAAYQVFAQYYLGLVGWLGQDAITPEIRDQLFRSALRQLMRGLGPGGEEP